MAGMADFYLRWGDALNKGINQIANAPNAYTDAQRNEQGYQNELQQFVDRRTQARRQERQDAFNEIDRQRKMAEEDRLRAEAEKEQARKDDEFQRMMNVRKWVTEQEDKTLDRDILIRKMLGEGVLQPKDYLELTKPAQPSSGMTFEERAELERIRAGLRPTLNDQHQITEIDGRKVKVNMGTGEKQDLGAITPKVSPKASENIKNKLQQLKLARSQIEKVKQSFKGIQGSFSAGPLGNKLPTEAGARFDADVDGLRQTIRALTRTPGEGGMSDFESKLAMAGIPERGVYESKTARQIENLEDMISLLESGYTGMQSEFEHPGSAPATPTERDPLGLGL